MAIRSPSTVSLETIINKLMSNNVDSRREGEAQFGELSNTNQTSGLTQLYTNATSSSFNIKSNALRGLSGLAFGSSAIHEQIFQSNLNIDCVFITLPNFKLYSLNTSSNSSLRK